MSENTGAATSRGRTVAINGLNVHVVEAGEGPPVVLLHGFPQSSREWSGVSSRLAEVAHVIAPDMRGTGGTDAPHGSYGIDAVCGDTVALLDALGIERAVIVGHDVGALTALALAAAHPERVTHLVVISVPPRYLRMTASMLGSMKYLWFQYALAIPGLGPRLLSRGHQRLPRWLFSSFARAGGVPAADVDAYLADLRDPAKARASSRKYRQLVLPEFMRIVLGRYRDNLPTAPTLVLLGEADSILPRDALAGVEEYARDVTIEEIPDAGHWVVDEAPDEVARHIATFAGLVA